ncbi:uncharacterized protein ISCGN_001986 [Ixodes scapularis]
MGTYSSRTGNCKSVGQVLGHVVSFKHQGEQARPGEQATPQELARPEPPELFLMPLRNMEQLSAAEAQLKNFTNRTLPIQQEFRRQTGRDAQEGLTAFLERSTKALYVLFRMKSSSKQKEKRILEAAENCPEEGKTLLANDALILLPCLLKERSNNLVKSLQ